MKKGMKRRVQVSARPLPNAKGGLVIEDIIVGRTQGIPQDDLGMIGASDIDLSRAQGGIVVVEDIVLGRSDGLPQPKDETNFMGATDIDAS